MPDEVIAYEWTCPICGIDRVCLAFHARSPIEGQAAHAIRTHVQYTDDDGHGDRLAFPPGFEEVELSDYVTLRERIGGQATTEP